MSEPTFETWILSLAYSRRRDMLLAGLRNGTAITLDADTLEKLATFTPRTPFREGWQFAWNAITTCAFAPDGDTAACGTEQGPVFLLDQHLRPFWSDRVELSFAGTLTIEPRAGVQSLGLENPFVAEPDPVARCTFAPDGTTCIITRASGMTVLHRSGSWNVLSRTETRHPILACAFSPDGKLLAVGDSDGNVDLQDASDTHTVRHLGRHRAPVCCCSWSPSGELLATGSFDESLRLWRLDTRKAEVRRIRHKARVNDCVFTPDSRYVASASGWGPDRRKIDGQELTVSAVSTGECLLRMPLPHPPVGVCALGDGFEFAVAVGKTIHKVTAEQL